MWAERGISQLLFNIVPIDIDAFVPPLHELEEPPLVKVGVLGMNECSYGCFSVFIGGEMVPFECPLQSREEVEVAGHQVAIWPLPHSKKCNERTPFGIPKHIQRHLAC
jgi:hypothetical protein